MSQVPPDMMCFDVERGLAKALSIKCETYKCGPDEYRIRIGQRWNLVLDQEQLECLWDAADNPTALKDAFNEIKPSCLAFLSYTRQ